MTLISTGDFESAIVVVPGAKTEKAGGGQHLRPVFRIDEIAGDLRFDEFVERHIVVESLNDPIAIGIRVGVWTIAFGIRIQTSIVIFAVARDVEPDAAPALAVLRRGKKSIDNLRKSIRRGVFFK